MSTQAKEIQKVSPADEMRLVLSRMTAQFQAALPAHIKVDRFIRVAMTAVQLNQDLLGCDRTSLISSFMRAAQDGLLPDGREGAIVSYGRSAQWMPMIAGIMKKVRNSGEIATWSLRVVKENDEFDYQEGDDEKIFHRPAIRDRGETIGAYSIVTLRSGERSRDFMSIEDIERIRAKSKAKSGPWTTDFDEMAKKTVARRHSKVLPMSTDLDQVLNGEESDDEQPVIPAVITEVQPQPAQALGEKKNRLSKIIEAQAPVSVEEQEREAISAEVPV